MNQQLIGATFTYKKPSTVKTKPCRILFQQKYITTQSGKNIWRNLGFAKLALLNHITSTVNNRFDGSRPGWQNRLSNSEAKVLIAELVDSGVIQFVEAEIESFAESKRF